MVKTTKSSSLPKKKVSSKKLFTSNVSKVAPKKVAPKKAAPKKVAPKKVAPKKVAPKKVAKKSSKVPPTTPPPAPANPPPPEVLATPELVKRKRTKINLETYIEKITHAVKKCDVEIERLSSNPSGERKGIKTLKSVRRTLLDLETKAPKLTKLRRRYKMSGTIRKNSGLTTPQNISDELREFLKIEEGRNLSRIEVTRAINSYINIKKDERRLSILEWAYLNPNHRNLQNEKDKRIIFPDKPLAKLLRYAEYKKAVESAQITEAHKNKLTGLKETKIVTSSDLHYRTVQKLIQVHYL